MAQSISKESRVQLGLVISLVAVAVAAAMWASRMISTVEQVGDDISEIKSVQKEQWVFTRRIYEDVIRNGERISSVDSRLTKVEGRGK